MLLKKITLHPFAGIINKTFEFEAGMNVLYGVNEAGKSTLMKAIAMVLFDLTEQTPSAGEKLLNGILPLGGGDFVAVDLEFEINNEYYFLKKQWGKTNFSSLHKLNEAPITDPKDVQNKLNVLLLQNRNVWESVMFASHTTLSTTHKSLVKNQQVISDFDSLLQNAIINNAGFAPEDIQLQLKNQLNLLINRPFVDSIVTRD